MTLPHIDISLTSISSRLSTLPETLSSLLAQDYPNFTVNLYLSRDPYMLDEGVPELPQKLAGLIDGSAGRLRCKYCKNIGPYRKLIPYLYENWGLSRLVVTVDDDTIYPETWLRQMVDSYNSFGCVIAYRGHEMQFRNGALAPYRTWMRSGIQENPSSLLLPTGKDGVLYDTAYFSIDVFNMEEAKRLAPTTDDLWFRWHLALNGIRTYIINTDYTRETFTESDYDSSLYLNFNISGGNDAAVERLYGYFKEHHGFDITSLAREM
ncbi:MAG: glycosyltransferase family 2 protein [Pseudomonadota bacterium]